MPKNNKHRGWECLIASPVDGVQQNVSYSEEYGYTAVYPHGDFAAKEAAEMEVEQAFAPSPQPTNTNNNTKKAFRNLIRCDKWSFDSGEKKLFAGWMNQWVDVSQEDVVQHVFLYRQPVTYSVTKLKDPFTMSKRAQVLECIKQGLYTLPFSAYSQRLTAWAITQYPEYPGWTNIMRLSMLSSDDDIINVYFPEGEIAKVKAFVKSNFKALTYKFVYDWAMGNAYKMY